jgi:hypothetical protein
MTATDNGAATPLSRFGSRVPTTPIRRTTRPAVPAATTARPAVPATTVHTPAATIRSMIVCLPDGLPSQALTASRLDRHFGVSGTLQARFWAVEGMWVWQHQQLFTPRKGRPVSCAGGPVKLLDLAGMRQAAGVGAGIRHQVWQQVVHGTRPAHPWRVFQTRHLADPAKYPLDRAEAEFWNQPRVNAMRLHNAAGYGTAHLAVAELEMFQAGPIAYQHYSATTAVCGDALLTPEGHRFAPASDALAHRVTYLEQAARYLDTVEADQRLLAVALTVRIRLGTAFRPCIRRGLAAAPPAAPANHLADLARRPDPMSHQPDQGTSATPAQPTYPHVHIQLTGADGNALAIIGAVARALRRDAGPDAATTFTTAAYACGSYDELLYLAMTTVDVG